MDTSAAGADGQRGRGHGSESARVFAALGDPTRLAVVTQLCREGPSSIASLTAATTVTRQAVAKHLRVLADSGLVRGRRCGRESIWEIEPAGLDVARRFLSAVSRRWDEALARLKSAVEE